MFPTTKVSLHMYGWLVWGIAVSCLQHIRSQATKLEPHRVIPEYMNNCCNYVNLLCNNCFKFKQLIFFCLKNKKTDMQRICVYTI